MNIITTKQVENSLYFHFKNSSKIIGLNLSYLKNIFLHEIDFLLVSEHNYLTEIEIKISKSDLKNDFKKSHDHPITWHKSNVITIKRQYFCIPHTLLEECEELIPQHFGILIVKKNLRIEEVRKPRINKAIKLTDNQILQLAILQARKYWYRRVGGAFATLEEKESSVRLERFV